MNKEPRKWDEGFDKEFFTPEEIEASDRWAAEMARQMNRAGVTAEEAIRAAETLVKSLPSFDEETIASIKANPSLSWLQKRKLVREIRRSMVQTKRRR